MKNKKLKKIKDKIKKSNIVKSILSKTFREAFNMFIVTIISSVISTIIATIIIDNKNMSYIEEQQRNKLLYDIQTICIGCNKEWMDSAFGEPTFTNLDEDIREDVYVVDIALIRAFFDIKDNSCKMFFITQTTEMPIPFMPTIKNTYYNIGEEKKLGLLTYDEIQLANLTFLTAYGFFTNGTGRTFYGEVYTDYRYNILFASLDYGENSPWNMMGYIYTDEISEKEALYYEQLEDTGLNKHKLFLNQREKFYPNTYGISVLDSDYSYEKLMDYNTFDSMQTAYR